MILRDTTASSPAPESSDYIGVVDGLIPPRDGVVINEELGIRASCATERMFGSCVERSANMRVVSGPGLTVASSGTSFYARIEGEALRRCPSIHVRVPPIIDFSTHDLAHEAGWYLKARQKFYHNFRGSPKVTIAAAHRKNCFLKFCFPRDLSIHNLRELFVAMRETAPHFEVVNIPLHPRVYRPLSAADFARELAARVMSGELDEVDVVGLFNEQRYERIKDFLAGEEPLPPVTFDNVISILDEIERRRPAVARVSEDTLERVAAFLESAA